MTATEIYPISWVEDDQRMMGFRILGAPDPIRRAIGEMIKAIRAVDNYRARGILTGFKKAVNQDKKKPKRVGSKSSKPCRDFKKGHCQYGDDCKFQHKKMKK